SGILTALYERERTGRGTSVEVSLFDSLVEWMGYPIYYTRYGGTAPARTGTNHAAIAPYGTVRCAEGREVVMAIQNEREWRAFCTEVLGDTAVAFDPRFAAGPDRVRHRAELDELIAARTSSMTADQLIAALDRAGIAHAHARQVADVVRHPHLVQRRRWVPVDTEAGPIEALLPPLKLSGTAASMGAVPALGEHTAAVLAEFLPSDDQGSASNGQDMARRAGCGPTER
ncbi:MAG: CoA transferase, partial [Trebonia sp.]